MVYFKHKQVSVSEATYRLIRGLDLKKSNIACVYVATGFPANRSSFFRSAKSTEKSTDVEIISGEQCKDEDNLGCEVTIEGREGKFKEVETIHQKYSQRPESLKEVCLAQFATSYVLSNLNRIPKEINWDNGSSSQNGHLREFISERDMPKYIRYHNFGCRTFK